MKTSENKQLKWESFWMTQTRFRLSTNNQILICSSFDLYRAQILLFLPFIFRNNNWITRRMFTDFFCGPLLNWSIVDLIHKEEEKIILNFSIDKKKQCRRPMRNKTRKMFLTIELCFKLSWHHHHHQFIFYCHHFYLNEKSREF